jgi:hypothetical protein
MREPELVVVGVLVGVALVALRLDEGHQSLLLQLAVAIPICAVVAVTFHWWRRR